MVGEVRPAVVRIDTGSGSGSGVIFETQGQTGYIVTNHHVVEGEALVSVTVNDSAVYSGTVLGTNAVRDLAVVSICCDSFKALPFGDAAALRPGDAVVAIGYALGLQGQATVTRGIVSAIRYESAYSSNVIQTDAAINPGNSGGPLLSMSGQILGINTFRHEETGGGRPVEGLGFAISGTTVQSLVPALKAAPPAPTPTPTPTPSPEGYDAFGPTSGELQHDPTDGFIKTEYAGVEMADMIVSATFVNPYSASSNDWDYGFILRHEPDGQAIHLVLDSDRRWALNYRETPSAENLRLDWGTLGNFNTGAGERNYLIVVAIEGRGWLFVNGEFVSSLFMVRFTGSGDVAVMTGAFTGNEVAGAVTRFENFRGELLSLSYGPAAGRLEKELGFIATDNSGVRARDLVVESEFVNPPGSEWDYGFLIRNPKHNRLEVIGLTGDAWWFHDTRDVGDDEYTDKASGWLSSAGINLLSKNHLLLIAIQESGWFFVNGQLVAKLDLGHNLDSGWVSAMGDYFLKHQGSPSFENFNVWTP